ncbi:hypothetical protein SEA_KOZIE_28 [Microbacterium phage Kozie]|uniref:Uncharacterized protein n=1 Tax=Microbacterium phage Kozie TaxID=2885981 RepID=A0AAE8Y7P2_9CAUD|nr:hypothetical protein QC998_gp28 [Microbacterium phage Kozie]UDL16224.1 hypothetical protein SEA_KOZIE_28 [Microbacterium phage Kozie]
MATDRITPLLDVYADAALAVLDPVPGRVIRYQPGEEVAWDGCCDGQLALRVISIDLASPQANGQGLVCGGNWWNVRVGLSLIRCVGVVNDKGAPPTAARINADGSQMLADIAALQEVVMCAGYTAAAPAPVWQPLGPQGGCAGGEWQFTVRTSVCACPDPLPWAEAPEEV